jgi:hypothetical protein
VPKFALLIYTDESGQASASQEQMAQVMKEYNEYTEAITAEGINKGGEALQPTATAKSVQVRDGERLVSDGPFAETKEQLGGFYIVECETEDQALGAAARLPGSKWGTVEVRPVWEIPEQPA